jgi:TonB-linked SusC/RagA family outer membrane protein
MLMIRLSSLVLRRAGLAGALLLCSTSPLVAQATGTIRGRVTDAGTNRLVADAQIALAGTQFGAVTNQNGDYVITGVAAGTYTVTARRLGFSRAARSVTVTAGAEERADLGLRVAASTLDAVVVTGTAGATEKRTVGNAITQLDVADLTSKQTVVNVTEVLQSKTPGVTILPGSGAPGTAGEIRIRGASSISGYRPVVFVDGVRYSIEDLGGFSATGGGTQGLAQSSQVTSALNNLNPNDIESIEVIKGPAAATLYGAEASNGVIQIITKKGTRGQQSMRWGFKAERGRTDWNLLPEDNYTTCDALKQAQLDAQGTPLWPGCQNLPVNTIIRDNPMARDPRALRKADIARLSMNVRGGGERYSYYLAGDRDTEQGVFYNSDNSRSSARANFGFSPNDKSDFALNFNWQNGRLRLPIQDESANGLLLSARRGLPGRASLLGPGNEGWRTISPTSANRYKNFTSNERLTIGATLNVNPTRWFQNRLIAGFDNNTTQAQLLFLPGDVEITQDPDAASGANLRRTPTRSVLTLDYASTLLYNPRTNLETTTRFGAQVVGDKTEVLSATGIGIGAPDVTLVNLLQRTTGGEGFSENNSVGYYVQEQVGWNNRLFVTAAVRADNHSSFGANFRASVYPKLSVSYVVSEEPAAKRFIDAARINSLKLRGAWGQAGRAPTAYSAPQTYTVDRVTLGTNTASAIRTAAYGNPDLKPEKGEEIELGFEMGALQDRFGADFTYYNKKTTDMLQFISVPPSTGFISSRQTNLGTVKNTGIELSLFGTPVQRSDLSWDARVNLSTNQNVLESFGVEGRTVDTPSGQAYGSVQQHRPGFPLGGFWVTPPQRNPDGSAVLTPAGAAIFSPGDTARRYIGPSMPTKEIGFSNTFTFFKNFSFYALLDYKSGGYIYNLQERNRCQSNDNCWRTNNPAARFPQTATDTILWKELAVYRNASVSPEWIQKADFIKLREISLTMDVPQRLIGRSGAQSARLALSGRNLKIWSDYEGVDPEVNTYGGRNFVRVDAYASPQMRRLTAAVNLTY